MLSDKEKRKEYVKKYYEAHKDEIKARRKAWYEANKDKLMAQCKAYREAHRDELKAKDNARHEAHRDEERAQRKAYNEAHRDEVRAQCKAYREAHRDELRAQRKAYREAHRDEVRAQRKMRYDKKSELLYIWANEKKSKHVHENLCRKYLEHLFNKPFPCKHPPFLQNGHGRLELDGYNKELSLAFEYNGIMHYEYCPYFHDDMISLFIRMDNDKYKIERCKEEGVSLIVIPYTIDDKGLFNYIMTECERLGFADKFALEWI